MDFVAVRFMLNKWLLLKQQICVAWYLPNHSLLNVDWRSSRASDGWFLFRFKWRFANCWSDWEDWQVIYYQDLASVGDTDSPPVWFQLFSPAMFQLHQRHKYSVDGYKQSVTTDRTIFCVFHPHQYDREPSLCVNNHPYLLHIQSHSHFPQTSDGSSRRHVRVSALKHSC